MIDMDRTSRVVDEIRSIGCQIFFTILIFLLASVTLVAVLSRLWGDPKVSSAKSSDTTPAEQHCGRFQAHGPIHTQY